VAFYLDTSALVKLVVAEPASDAVRGWLAAEDRQPISSDLARTELLRAVRRGAPDRLVQARLVLDSITLIELTVSICEAAGRLDPAILRSLDALHVAAALDVGDDLDGLVTYDERLADAAAANGIPVVAPA
jgi:predicted nucleic acid-binding protein